MGDLLQRLALVFIQQCGLWSWRGGGAAPAFCDRPSRARYSLHHLAQKNQEAGAVLTGLAIGWRCSAAAPASRSGGSGTAELRPDSGEAGS
jgi:hypothetical protein